MRSSYSALLVLACGAGCGSSSGGGTALDGYPDAHIGSLAELQKWSGASAAGLFAFSYQPYNLASTAFAAGSDAGSNLCPAESGSSGAMTFTGGCTDDSGTTWTGTAAETNQGITYTHFGYTGSDGSSLVFQGVIEANDTDGPLGGGAFTMQISFTATGSAASQEGSGLLAYSGSVGADADDDNVTTWDGQGEFGFASAGKITTTTNTEVFDHTACLYTALGGTTTITAGGDTAVITYEGSDDCGSDAPAQWTLNGSAMGEIDNVACSATGRANALGALAPAGMIAFGLSLVRRRRARRA